MTVTNYRNYRKVHAYFIERGEERGDGLVVGFLRARKARLINTGVYVPENSKKALAAFLRYVTYSYDKQNTVL